MKKKATANFVSMLTLLNCLYYDVLSMAIINSPQKFRQANNNEYKNPTASNNNADTFHKKVINDIDMEHSTLNPSNLNRRKMIQTPFLYSITSLTLSSSLPTFMQPAKAINIPEQKSYSSNARNMERLNNGDASGGSSYNNSPDSPVAAKRRAMVGCKVSSSRIEASKLIENDGNGGDVSAKKKNVDVLSEKDCNMRVMGGDAEFMLKALRNLDCPTCPYGIDGA